MFVTLLDDESEAFARRAIAFKRVYFGATDQEREFFSQRLGLEYLRITGWHRSPNEKVLLEVTRDYRQRATVRLAAIRDEQLRRDAIFIGTENYFPSADSFLMPIRSQFQRTAGLARSQLPRE